MSTMIVYIIPVIIIIDYLPAAVNNKGNNDIWPANDRTR